MMIEPIEQSWIRRAEERQLRLTKPPGSLGRLEEIANHLCAIQRTLTPVVKRPTLFVFAGDHGVCEEGVNPYPQSVTGQMVANFLAGGAAINALANTAGAELMVVNVGVIGSLAEHLKLINRCIAPGTKNMCREPAMSWEEAEAAISVGIDCAADAITQGATLLAIGEMGIGSTTAASAVCAALTGLTPQSVCGRGTGCDDAGFLRKISAVERALVLHRPHLDRPMELLARLGGLEIAAICGVCLEAARRHCAVVMDGFISTAGAALAVALNEHVRDYLIAAHQSSEPGHRALLQWIRKEPLLDLQMRLGEGTGAALAIPLIRAAVEAFRCMATFDSAGVADTTAASLP